MYETFADGLEEAKAQNRLSKFFLRELRDVPRSLTNAYWVVWTTHFGTGIRTLEHSASISELSPAPPDGRDSWRQLFFEVSLFVTSGLLLNCVTYFDGMKVGRQHDIEFVGKLITWLTLPFLLLGLARGLPRWAYPFGGLFFGFHLFVSYQSGMWMFLFVLLLAFLIVTVAEVITDPQHQRLPLAFRRVGQSISVDWTRKSGKLQQEQKSHQLLRFKVACGDALYGSGTQMVRGLLERS